MEAISAANAARARQVRDMDVRLIAADSPESFPMRGDGGFEKAALVANLKGARDRKRRGTGKCGGRKSYAELSPETVALAKRLARYPVNGRKRSLRDVAAELQTAGRVSRNGTPYGAAAIARMIAA